MKEDRNCGNYPVYPNFYGGMPGPLPMGGVNMPMGMIGEPYNNGGVSDTLTNRLNSLEQRVANLENMINGSSYSTTSYNTTNYQVM